MGDLDAIVQHLLPKSAYRLYRMYVNFRFHFFITFPLIINAASIHAIVSDASNPGSPFSAGVCVVWAGVVAGVPDVGVVWVAPGVCIAVGVVDAFRGCEGVRFASGVRIVCAEAVAVAGGFEVGVCVGVCSIILQVPLLTSIETTGLALGSLTLTSFK